MPKSQKSTLPDWERLAQRLVLLLYSVPDFASHCMEENIGEWNFSLFRSRGIWAGNNKGKIYHLINKYQYTPESMQKPLEEFLEACPDAFKMIDVYSKRIIKNCDIRNKELQKKLQYSRSITAHNKRMRKLFRNKKPLDVSGILKKLEKLHEM